MEHQKTMSSVIPQKLPLGVTDFSQIRTENYYYVDKTQFMVDQPFVDIIYIYKLFFFALIVKNS